MIKIEEKHIRKHFKNLTDDDIKMFINRLSGHLQNRGVNSKNLLIGMNFILSDLEDKRVKRQQERVFIFNGFQAKTKKILQQNALQIWSDTVEGRGAIYIAKYISTTSKTISKSTIKKWIDMNIEHRKKLEINLDEIKKIERGKDGKKF